MCRLLETLIQQKIGMDIPTDVFTTVIHPANIQVEIIMAWGTCLTRFSTMVVSHFMEPHVETGKDWVVQLHMVASACTQTMRSGSTNPFELRALKTLGSWSSTKIFLKTNLSKNRLHIVGACFVLKQDLGLKLVQSSKAKGQVLRSLDHGQSHLCFTDGIFSDELGASGCSHFLFARGHFPSKF